LTFIFAGVRIKYRRYFRPSSIERGLVVPPKGRKKKREDTFPLIQGSMGEAVGPKRQYTGQRVLMVHPATLGVFALVGPTLLGLQKAFSS